MTIHLQRIILAIVEGTDTLANPAQKPQIKLPELNPMMAIKAGIAFIVIINLIVAWKNRQWNNKALRIVNLIMLLPAAVLTIYSFTVHDALSGAAGIYVMAVTFKHIKNGQLPDEYDPN